MKITLISLAILVSIGLATFQSRESFWNSNPESLEVRLVSARLSSDALKCVIVLKNTGRQSIDLRPPIKLSSLLMEGKERGTKNQQTYARRIELPPDCELFQRLSFGLTSAELNSVEDLAVYLNVDGAIIGEPSGQFSTLVSFGNNLNRKLRYAVKATKGQ